MDRQALSSSWPRPTVPAAARSDVLVVDDDRDIRESLQEVLELEGYRVTTARNGLEALNRLREARPALVLVDLFMPVMDGIEFRQRQLEDPSIADVPVFIVSAAVMVRERFGALPVNGFVEKPLRVEKLFEIVRRFCGPSA